MRYYPVDIFFCATYVMFNNQHTNSPMARQIRQNQRQVIRNMHQAPQQLAAEAKRDRKNTRRLRNLVRQEMAAFAEELKHWGGE